MQKILLYTNIVYFYHPYNDYEKISIIYFNPFMSKYYLRE